MGNNEVEYLKKKNMVSRVKHKRIGTLKLRILKMLLFFIPIPLQHTNTHATGKAADSKTKDRQNSYKQRKITKGKGGSLGQGLEIWLLDSTKGGSAML